MLSQADGVAINERDFFAQPLSRDELKSLLDGRSAREAFSFKSPAVKNMGLEPDRLSDDELLDLMVQEPRLLRRPVIQMGDRLLIGPSIKQIQEALA